ncbi:MAG: conjugative transposon protein TraN [Bacteroidota bacterium]
MKLLMIFCLLLCIDCKGQVYTTPLPLQVATGKTVNLIFSSTVVAVDRGAEQVIVQKSPENILRVKAVRVFDSATSLSVVTSDGKVYSFLVSYCDTPAHLDLFFGNTVSAKVENKLMRLCDSIASMKGNVIGLRYASGKVSLQLLGWFVKGQQLFCKLKLDNRSQIGYDIEQVHYYLRDNHAAKRTAYQESIIQPLCVTGDSGTIKAHSSRVWIVAMSKFTIPDEKHFAVEILERNGGRHVSIKSYNRQVLIAKEL